jgi:hypothetical protein
MREAKPYKCTICGAEIPNLPMPVLQHQMSHVRRRTFADGWKALQRHDRPPAEKKLEE